MERKSGTAKFCAAKRKNLIAIFGRSGGVWSRSSENSQGLLGIWSAAFSFISGLPKLFFRNYLRYSSADFICQAGEMDSPTDPLSGPSSACSREDLFTSHLNSTLRTSDPFSRYPHNCQYTTMPKAKVLPSLSGMIDTPDQSDEEMTTTVDSNQENAAPVKKGRGRAAAARKTKPASKRLSGGKPKATTASKKAATKRAPLKDQSNLQPSDTEEVDDFEEEVASTFVKPNARNKTTSEAPEVQKPKRKGRPPGKGKAAAVKPEVEVEPVPVITEKDGDFEYTPRQTKPNGKVVKDSQPEEAPPERIVQETQAMEVDGEAPVDDDTIVPQSTYRKANNARAGSRQAAVPVYNGHRRAGSASDTERGGDPAIRRKLGDLTQKFESLDLKYRHLREVGVKEAEANFEKLRKQSEEKAKSTPH